jgi:antitoxin CptB
VTGTTKSSGGLDARQRRLLFRSWHRGTREMDLIMGRFADAWIERLSADELDAYERLIEVPDPELYAWIAGQEATPPAFDTELLRRLRAFHLAADDTT